MHQELLHVDFKLKLALVLHLVQVDQLLMSHNLVLVVRVREEEVRFVIAEGLISNLKLNENARELDGNGESELKIVA
jgi:hypothetical protein